MLVISSNMVIKLMNFKIWPCKFMYKNLTMQKFKYIFILLVPFVHSLTCAAEWKNPDLQQPEQWQNPDQAQPGPVSTDPKRGQNRNTPVLPDGEVGIETTWACNMQLTYNDKGSGGEQDVMFFHPVTPAGYSLLGGFAQGNHYRASDCVLAVRPVNKQSEALLTRPQDWERIWTDKNSGSRRDGSIWRGISGNPDYTCLGSMAVEGYSKPAMSNYVCLHQCLLEDIPVTDFIWSDRGTGASQNVSIYKLQNSHYFHAISSYNKPNWLKDIKRNPVCSF